MKKLTSIFTLLLSLVLFGYYSAHAQETVQIPFLEEESEQSVSLEGTEYVQPQQETMKGKVIGVSPVRQQELYGQVQNIQDLKIKLNSGSMKGESVDVIHGIIPEGGAPQYQLGDKVYLLKATAVDGMNVFYVTDYDRTGNMLFLFIFFAFLVILVSRWWGVSSLVGMAFTFLVIFKFLLPKISDGGNPIVIAISSAAIIAPVTFYLSHGLNKKTTTALIGTIISLVLTGILATIFIGLVKLTGYGSEESMFLQVATGGSINIKGLLLAGIIIGSLGILDDVTVTQASLVDQLRKANKDLDVTELFRMAMDVGHDHIASTVNTLVLVYTGAALPLLLLFVDNPISTVEILNAEIIAEEVVRTLVSSIGLILAIPITTLIAVVEKKQDLSQVKVR